MLVRVVLVLSLCVLGFGCEKKSDSGEGTGKITVNEGGTSQAGKAEVKDADEGQQEGVVSTPGDPNDDDDHGHTHADGDKDE